MLKFGFQNSTIAILTTLAKQESIRFSERTKAGMPQRRAEGMQMGPPVESIMVIERIHELT